MTDWIEWHGEYPGTLNLLGNLEVEVKRRDGTSWSGDFQTAFSTMRWAWELPYATSLDIVACRFLSKNKKLTPEELDKARWSRANRTHPSNYACAGIEAARLARVGWTPDQSWETEVKELLEDIRKTFRGSSPGSHEEKLWMRINVLLKEGSSNDVAKDVVTELQSPMTKYEESR